MMGTSSRHWALVVAAGLVAALMAAAWCDPARADELTSKGTVLHGKVTHVSSAGIDFEPEYGKGSIAIKWEDIEDLKTEGPVQVLYEDEEADAPLQGMRDGKLLVGDSAESARELDPATIELGVPIGAEGPALRDRMRSAWRYWDGNFDVGLNIQRATNDNTGFAVGFKTTRSKAPTRLILAAGYRYASEKTKEKVAGQTVKDENRTQDQALGLIRGEYDFTKRWFGFGSFDATYDGVQRLSLRAVPRVGVGYVIWEQQLDADRRNFLSADIGPGWVYEKFFGGEDDDFFTIGLGASAAYYLPYGSKFDWRFDYLPAIDDFSDYVIRNTAGLSIPLWDPISAKIALVDEYDSTPAEVDVDEVKPEKNSLSLILGVSVLW
jgi:hypothetical protein